MFMTSRLRQTRRELCDSKAKYESMSSEFDPNPERSASGGLDVV